MALSDKRQQEQTAESMRVEFSEVVIKQYEEAYGKKKGILPQEEMNLLNLLTDTDGFVLGNVQHNDINERMNFSGDVQHINNMNK